MFEITSVLALMAPKNLSSVSITVPWMAPSSVIDGILKYYNLSLLFKCFPAVSPVFLSPSVCLCSLSFSFCSADLSVSLCLCCLSVSVSSSFCLSGFLLFVCHVCLCFLPCCLYLSICCLSLSQSVSDIFLSLMSVFFSLSLLSVCLSTFCVPLYPL